MTSIAILTRPDDVLPHLDRVVTVADTHKEELGFFSPSVYRESANRGRLWVALRPDRMEAAGFLRFGGTHTQLKVWQIFTLESARRRGVARRLLDKLVRYGENRSVLSITARVAADLPANEFWERSGFALQRTVPGGKTTNRQINIYLRELNVPSLLRDAPPLEESRPPAAQALTFRDGPRLQPDRWALDLNVVFDAFRQRDDGESLWLIAAAPVVVTAELLRELERTSSGEKDDGFLRVARGLPRLPEPPADQVAGLMGPLRAALGLTAEATSRRSVTDASDLRHLAACVYHQVSGFVTRDSRILRSAGALYRQYGLRVAAPADLVPPHSDVDDPTAAEVMAELDHSLLSGRPPNHDDRAPLVRFLKSLGLSTDRVAAALDPGTTQQPAEQRLVRKEDRILGVATLKPPLIVGQPYAAHVHVEEGQPESLVAAEHLFDWLLTRRTRDRLYRIDLHAAPGQLTTKQVAHDCGFRRGARGSSGPSAPLSKMVYGGFVLPDRWQTFRADFQEYTGLRLPRRMSSWADVAATGIEIRQADGSSDRIPVLDFETLISPGLLLPTGRPGVVAPIQPSYADRLLPPTVTQSSILPGQEAALRLERAYFFRAGRHRMVSPGTIVVFYLSGTRMEAAAVARTTFSATLSTEEAVTTLRRQGVLSPDDIEARADSRGRVTAFTFDCLTGMPRSIPHSQLRQLKCVGPLNYVSPEAISHEQLLRIVSAGFEEFDS